MKADPDASFLSEELSDLYIRPGKPEGSGSGSEEALKQNPKGSKARRILGRIYTRMIGDTQQGKIDENMLKKAIEQYQKIAELDRRCDNWLMLGRLQTVAGSSVEAEKAYKKESGAGPRERRCADGLAKVYADLGNTKAATELLRQVASKRSVAPDLDQPRGSYEQIRDYALAAETLKRAMKSLPAISTSSRYAQDLLLSDQYAEALKV